MSEKVEIFKKANEDVTTILQFEELKIFTEVFCVDADESLDWQTWSCNCTNNLKNRICEHKITVAVVQKKHKIDPKITSQNFKKPKRGKRKGVSSALIRDD